jgi:nucleoside-diphosphate-sugar epimerase
MSPIERDAFIVGRDDPILVTGATGFIGPRLVKTLIDQGFRNLRCFARPLSSVTRITSVDAARRYGARVEVIRGNLLSPEDCTAATRDAKVIFHLAAGGGDKSFADAFMNSVVTTRNLLEGCLRHRCLRRFVNVSSFSVYTSPSRVGTAILDESCPVEPSPELRGEAYCFAKVKQDEILTHYAREYEIPYVIVRPGVVYGPGKVSITGRVGIDTFGVFLHLGGSNAIPFTYVDNCAEAIALAGLREGVDGEVFNVVDDDLPSSREFLRLYKRHVKYFTSLYVPHIVSYGLCYLWERYANWSEGQLPLTYNRRRWRAFWKKTYYSNDKVKRLVGWMPRTPTDEGLKAYFEACRAAEANA